MKDIDILDCLCRKHNNIKGDLWSWKISLGLGLMVLASASSSASKVCPRPRPWPRRFVLGLGLGLENLSSFNITVALILPVIFTYFVIFST